MFYYIKIARRLACDIPGEAVLRARPEHWFFASDELVEAWNDCARGENPESLSASLALIAERRRLLPGAVFFRVPDGKLKSPEWAAAIEASQPHCKCETRRIMYPLVGRSRLLLRSPATRSITVARGLRYAVDNYYDSRPLVLAPCGGDAASAYAAFVMKDDELIVEMRPFMTYKKATGKKQIWTPHDGIVDRAPGLWRADAATLRDVLQLHGELPFMQAIPNPAGKGDMGTLPLCSLVGVNYDADGGAPRFTFEIDATVRLMTDLDETTEEHDCTA